jgi:tocopherol cyclase
MIFQRLRAIFNPEIFQGWGKTRSYFEGWYFKIIDTGTTHALAVIPGLALDEKGKGQAFIQVLDGMNRTARYHQFSVDQFSAAPDLLDIRIGQNRFTGSTLDIDLPEVSGRLDFLNSVPWPKPFYAPGIMGPYSFAPYMECYHGIISMDHRIEGKLVVNGLVVDFNGGRGYAEKDWGSSFPSAYFWLQSNHFGEPGISLKASVAKIPWRGTSFTGFIAGLWIRDHLYRFTTYNRTRLVKLDITNHKTELILENRKYLLMLKAFPDKAVSLASPVRGAMEGRIEESMTSRTELILISKGEKKTVYEGKSEFTGLEIAGDISEIVTV